MALRGASGAGWASALTGAQAEKLGRLLELVTTLGGVLVWDSPRREGVLPAGDNRGNWNVTWVPADV